MILTYNEIRLPYASVNQFDKTAVPDPSNTDRALMRYQVEVMVTLTYDYMAAVLGNEADADAMPYVDSGSCQVRIHDRLMTRRKQLKIELNGRDMIPTPGNPQTVDASNGPIPQYCRITHIDNKTCMLLYAVTAHYYEILDTGSLDNVQSPSPVVYNRWKESVEIDDCDSVTRVREGSLRIRSDFSEPITPDMLRADCACVSIPDGFLRTGRTYQVSEDGLTLRYRVVDQEQFRYPPTPAFRAEGYYRETAINASGANRIGECRTILWGSNQTPQGSLLNTALAICVRKLQIVGAPFKGNDNQKGILLRLVVEVDHYKNRVDVILTVKFPVDKQRVNWVGGIKPFITRSPFQGGTGSPAPGQPASVPGYRVYGTGGILLQAASYYDPEAGNAALVPGVQQIDPLNNQFIAYGDSEVNTEGTQPGMGDGYTAAEDE